MSFPDSNSKYQKPRFKFNPKSNFIDSSSFISYMRSMQTPGTKLFQSKVSKYNHLNENKNLYETSQFSTNRTNLPRRKINDNNLQNLQNFQNFQNFHNLKNVQKRSLSTQKEMDYKNYKINDYNEIKEKLWNPYFQAMCSKDNKQVHSYKREFFDKPFDYNPSGVRFPLLNFEYKKINKGLKLNLTMDNSNSNLNSNSNPNQSSLITISNSQKSRVYKDSKSNSTMINLNRNLPQISLLNEKKKEANIIPIKDYVVQIPNLRSNFNSNEYLVKKENSWFNRCDHFSKRNEVYYRRYRINFDNIHLKNKYFS